MDRKTGFGTEGIDGPGEDRGLDDGVLRALASIRSAVGELQEAVLWSRSDACARDGVREGFEALQSLESSWLGLVADLDSRPGAVSGPGPGV
jgi:hypothetical protein